MFRPLISLSVEYILAFLVYKKGKHITKTIFCLLFLLATYQLGEFIFILTSSEIGIRIAYVSTTLLPPFGILIAEKLSNKKFGYPIFLALSIFFALLFAFKTGMVSDYKLSGLFIQVNQYDALWGTLWKAYYTGSLTVGISIFALFAFKEKNLEKKKIYLGIFIGYFSFFPTSIFFISFLKVNADIMTSFMCAMALVASFFFAKTSMGISMEEIVTFVKRKMNLN
jgi:hypothetical protein